MADTELRPNAGHSALRRGRASLLGQVYHVTAATISRMPVFVDPRVAQAAVHCFENPTLLGDARMLAWVLMPDHAHWLFELGEQHPLPTLVNMLKGFSARNANRILLRRGPIWARGFHDRAIRHDQDITEIARYIVANPLRAGLVQQIGEYPFCGTIWSSNSPSVAP